jgi:hypothetical protein
VGRGADEALDLRLLVLVRLRAECEVDVVAPRGELGDQRGELAEDARAVDEEEDPHL